MQEWMNDEYEPAFEEWEVWLSQKDEERKKTERLEQHKVWVEKLLDSAEGRAGLLHNSTKPREDVFGDAQPLKRVEVQRQEW